MIDDCFPWFIFAIIAGFIVIVIFAGIAGSEREKEMIGKCTPNPSLFECQLYLANKGRASISNAAMCGAAAGIIIANSATSKN